MTNMINLDLYPLPGEDESVKVVFLRGIPASGKSTFAKAHLEAYPAGQVIRINNDDLSSMLFGAPWGANPIAADLLHTLRVKMLETAIAEPYVRLIFVDNTNLQISSLNKLVRVVSNLNATFIIDDRFLSVDVEECIARDLLRTNPVGAGIIRKMHATASRLTPWIMPAWNLSIESFLDSLEAYPNSVELPETIIVDIDGTLAIMGDRSPYAWSRVGIDTPNKQVVNFVKDRIKAGHKVIIMSGRDGVCRAETQEWLDRYVASGLPLFMRTIDDNRPDYIVKHELFQANIAGKYHVSLVLDDRDMVVRLWRALGLNCWQVAEGNF